jgi:D-alanyl-D-alanine dipeptidase
MGRPRIGIAVALLIVSNATLSGAQSLPTGFVYLRDVDASIVQDIRYAGAHNFVGRPIAGYEAGECVLTGKAARALGVVQAALATRQLSLIVWDCYRPARAVADFWRWSLNAADDRMRPEFYPRIDKSRLFALGYIAKRSGHSRGSTVDLGIAPAGLTAAPAYDPTAAPRPCLAPAGRRVDEGAVDLGTSYDCMDAFAATDHQAVGKTAIENRRLLQTLMVRAGFAPYAKEWWHFQLGNEPFPGQVFDFPIKARPAR